MNFSKLFSRYGLLIITVIVISGAVVFLPQFFQVSQQKAGQNSTDSSGASQGDGVVFKFRGEVTSIDELSQSLVVRDDSNEEDVTVFFSRATRFVQLDYSLPLNAQEIEVGIEKVGVGSRVVVLAGEAMAPERELRDVRIIYVL